MKRISFDRAVQVYLCVVLTVIAVSLASATFRNKPFAVVVEDGDIDVNVKDVLSIPRLDVDITEMPTIETDTTIER